MSYIRQTNMQKIMQTYKALTNIRDTNRMMTKQNMMQAIIEAAKVAMMAVKEAENPVTAARSVQVMLGTSGPLLRQPTFDWKASDKYQEL